MKGNMKLSLYAGSGDDGDVFEGHDWNTNTFSMDAFLQQYEENELLMQHLGEEDNGYN